jgi:hypothetical protein
MLKEQKNPIKTLMAITITQTTKGKAKERSKKHEARRNQRQKKVNSFHVRKLSHP